MLIPTIFEEDARGRTASDIFSRLLKDRIVFLTTPINDEVAAILIAQLLFLEKEDPDRDIDLYINSPGGSVTAGNAVYDTMQVIKPHVATICIGMAASYGALLLCAGAPGKRYATPNARIMIHQPSGGFEGQATDAEINLREMMHHKNNLTRIMAKHSGQTIEKVAADAERDFWMGSEEAKAYGMIDSILHSEDR